MKKLVTILIILALAGGGAYWYYAYGRTDEKPTVVQAAISRGDITEVVRPRARSRRSGRCRSARRSPAPSRTSMAWTSTPSSRRVRSSPSSIRRCCRCRSTSSRRTSTARPGDIENQQIQLEDDQRISEPRPGAVRQGPRLAAGARAGGADGQEPPVVDRVGPEDARPGAGEPRAGQAERRILHGQVADRRRRRRPPRRRRPDGAVEHEHHDVLRRSRRT